jgi:hypothetical protein
MDKIILGVLSDRIKIVAMKKKLYFFRQ